MGVKLGNLDVSFKLGSGDCTVYLGETLIYSPEPSLPNVPFTVNYNAKNFDPATNTIAKETGQLADVDAVISGTVVSNGDYLTVSSGACASISGFSQYFNRNTSNESGTSLTIISKHKVGNSDDYCHLFSNRSGAGVYNWMYRTYPSIVQFHASSAHGGIPVTTQPVITSIRVEYVDVFDISYTYNNYTDNTTSAVTGMYSYGSDSNQANLFFGGYDDEYFAGDFYWIYITQNVLTDSQIQQVIEYNESLPTPPTPQTLQWVTFNSGDDISGLDVYGVKGTANDLYNTFPYTGQDIFFDLSRNIVTATIGGGCYTNEYGVNDNVEIVFSNVGCSDYYTLPVSMTAGSTVQLYIYQ